MGKPVKLPSGKWRVRWIALDGTRPSASFATEAQARAFLRRKQVEADDVRSGRVTAAVESPRFGAFVTDRWLPTYPAAAGNRELTIQEKRRHIERFLLPHLADVPLDRVRGEVADKLFAALRESGLSPKSIKNIRATLGTIVRSAKKWGVLAEVPELPVVKVPDQPWDFFSQEEAGRLYAAAVDDRERAMLIFAIHTGARWGELRAITWGDIDWNVGHVTIRRSMPHNTKQVAPTKSGRERRVPMSATLRSALLAIRGLNHLQGGLIFGRLRDGEPLSLYAVRERLVRACRRAGLREIRWHDLRHSFASQLVSAGVSLRRVQEWLGHSSIAMTERYSHLTPGTGDAIRVLDSGGAATTPLSAAAQR